METDWAWAAGLFEGEGCITFKSNTSVVLQVSMTDEDVVRKFQSVVGCGIIRTIEFSNGIWKKQYRLTIGDKDDVGRVLTKILPLLGQRRTEKAKSALLRLADNPGRLSKRSECKRGHPLPESLKAYGPDGKRRCRLCKHARDHGVKV